MIIFHSGLGDTGNTVGSVIDLTEEVQLDSFESIIIKLHKF